MTYDRNRENTVAAQDEVVVKKSTLTMLAVTIFVLLTILAILGWQNYAQSDRIDELTNNQNYSTRTVTHQQTATTPTTTESNQAQ